MSGHSYFSNHSQRYSAVAANLASNGALPSPGTNGTSAETRAPEVTRPRQPSTTSWSSRLSLSVDGQGVSGAAKTDVQRSFHPLRSTWVFWYRQHRGGKITNYEEGINKIAPFHSIESFWTLWTHLSPPSSLLPTTDYILFHVDVKRPVWEDPLNKDGGKWIIRLRKGIADRLWEDMVLALIGDQFEADDHVNGCVLSVRAQEDIISVWNKDDSDAEAKARIRDTIVRSLNLPSSIVLDYKSNNESLHDKSSFRTRGAEETNS